MKKSMKPVVIGAIFATVLSAGAAYASLQGCYPLQLPPAGKLFGDHIVPVNPRLCSSGRAWVKAGFNDRNGRVIRERTCGCA